MKFKFALIVLIALFSANFGYGQNTLNNIGLTSSTPASVAFSLRQLSTSYTGPLVRIKVASSYYDVYPDASTKNFRLSSKISAAIGTYNASVAVASANALSTIITGSTDATVAIWYDQSGNGVHVLSSNATAKIINAGTINTVNGQATIYFNGSTSSLVSSTTVNYSAQTTATINAVAQNVASIDYISGIISTGSSGGWGLCYDPTNSHPGYWIDATGGNGAFSNEYTSETKIVTGLIGTTTNSAIYINSQLKGTKVAQPISNGNSNNIYVGRRGGDIASRQFNGNISEIYMFPKNLSVAELSILESSQSIFIPPTVTITSSASGSICAGTSVTFTATTTGLTTPSFQWYKNGTAISGATNATYTTSSLSNNDQIKVICNNPPNLVNDNTLSLWLDAGNSASYSSGTTWRDLSGNGRNATLNNGASFDATSKSIVTNGVDQYVSVPLFNSSISNITMQTWVYINANSKGAFISNGTSSYSIGIGSSVSGEMSNNGNRAWMLFSSVRYIDTNTDYPSGWHLVTMTMDANAKPSYYLDGSFVYTSPSGSNPNTVSDSFNLGAVPGDGGKYYNGKFAAAYFYNRVLTASEILQNYNATVGTVGGGSASGIASNIISTSISTVPSASITVVGDACINKTTLNTPSGLSSYTWYKDNVAIAGATTNTYIPTAAGDYTALVSNGTCSTTSAATSIYICGVSADGKMVSIANPVSLLSMEGGANFGTGIDNVGKILNTTGLTTTTGTIAATTAVLGGIISATNAVTSSIGVVYSTDANFGTYSSSTIQSNVAAGTYTTTITGLTSETTYYTKSFVVNKAGTSYGPVVSFTTPARPVAIGDSYRGGIVVYIAGPSDPGYDANTTHGLIAAKVDLGSMNWNNGSRAYVSDNFFGAGIGNTATIIAQSGTNGGTNYAAKACDNYTVTETVGGITTTYDDWYLGSVYEIQKMLVNRSYLTGLLNSYYWSSSEQTGTGPAHSGVAVGDALYVGMGGGADQWNRTNGSGIMGVRAIRKF